MSSPPVTAAPQSEPQEIVFVAVGDVMLGTTFPDDTGGDLPPNDGADLLTEVTPILKIGDITFGNLEGPLVDDGDSVKCKGKKLGTCYAFRVPTRYAKYLKDAGFTVMGLANNHAMDFGDEGRASSRRSLEQMGIAHTGEVGDIAHLTVKGRKVEVIAFATYPNANNLLDLDQALQTICDARAESDIVIVSFHGGAEGATHQHVAEGDETFLGEDRGDLRKFAHAAIDAGAQVVVGSGPHVVRGMEVYHGKLIAYSLGNFATYGPFNLSAENGLSLILEAHLALDGSFLGGSVHPVKQEKPGGPKLDPAMAIVPILRDLSTTDFAASSVKVADDGSLTPPPNEALVSPPKPDAGLLKTGRFVYRSIDHGKDAGRGEIQIHKIEGSDNYLFSALVTGDFRPQQWQATAASDFQPVSAQLSFGQGDALKPSFMLNYHSGSVSGFVFSRTDPETRRSVDEAVPTRTVDQRIDWAAVLAGDLQPGQQFQFNVYDPGTGIGRVAGQVGAIEHVQVAAGSFDAYRIIYHTEKAGKIEPYQMLATAGKDRVMLWEEFPDGTTSELTQIQGDGMQADSAAPAPETKEKSDH